MIRQSLRKARKTVLSVRKIDFPRGSVYAKGVL